MKRSVLIRSLAAVILSVILIFGMGLLASCSGGVRVRVSGSSSVSPIIAKLAAAYESENKNVKIIVTSSDSTIGITDTIDGKNEIGMASRGLKASEIGLRVTKICDDGVVLIANKANECSGVTSAEVYNLYKNGTAIGDITSAISREEASGTRDAFDGLIRDTDGAKLSSVEQFADTVSIQNNTGAVMTEIAATASRIGYISLGSLNDTVKALRFNGVEASATNVKNGSYALARPFNLLTNEAETLSVAAQSFLDFVLSPAGQKIIADSGYVAL